MEEIRYNLHNHTHYSDGRLSPAGVVRANKQKGYNCIAITDHFSVDGIDEAIAEGTNLALQYSLALSLKQKKLNCLDCSLTTKTSN